MLETTWLKKEGRIVTNFKKYIQKIDLSCLSPLIKSAKKRYLVLLTLALLGSEFCFAEFAVKVVDQNGNPVESAVVAIPGVPEPPSEQEAIIDQVEKQFLPKISAINAGQSVHFPNSDDIRHHVYSFSKAKLFEIKLYSGTPSSPIVFDEPGIVILGCNIHDEMVGYIYVAGEELISLSNTDGIAILNQQVPDSFLVWHPEITSDPHTPIIVSPTTPSDSSIAVVKIQLKQKTVTKKSKFGSKFN